MSIEDSQICWYILGAVETFMDAVPAAGIFKGIFEYVCLSLIAQLELLTL